MSRIIETTTVRNLTDRHRALLRIEKILVARPQPAVPKPFANGRAALLKQSVQMANGYEVGLCNAGWGQLMVREILVNV